MESVLGGLGTSGGSYIHKVLSIMVTGDAPTTESYPSGAALIIAMLTPNVFTVINAAQTIGWRSESIDLAPYTAVYVNIEFYPSACAIWGFGTTGASFNLTLTFICF